MGHEAYEGAPASRSNVVSWRLSDDILELGGGSWAIWWPLDLHLNVIPKIPPTPNSLSLLLSDQDQRIVPRHPYLWHTDTHTNKQTHTHTLIHTNAYTYWLKRFELPADRNWWTFSTAIPTLLSPFPTAAGVVCRQQKWIPMLVAGFVFLLRLTFKKLVRIFPQCGYHRAEWN